MPAGNITQTDRLHRIVAIQKLLDDGKKPIEIAEEMGMPIQTVQRNIKYAKDLAVTDISPEVQAEKRKEIYTELLEITDKARAAFEKYIDEKPSTARQFLSSWMTALEKRANLFGLSSSTCDIQTQVNTMNVVPTRDIEISKENVDKLAKVLIAKHEKSLMEK